MELSDAHCHLLDPWFMSSEVPEIVRTAKANNVTTIINVGSTPEHYDTTISSAKEFKELYANIGLQPTHVSDQAFSHFKNFVYDNLENVSAIGEVGLDYYWIKDPNQQEIQRSFFVDIIDFANELKKPLVIHSRAAESDAIQLLEKYASVPVLMHCFEGSKDNVSTCLDNNFLVSVPTSVKNHKKYRRIAQMVPLENMTLETDAPFQSPYNSENGTKPPKNEPKNIHISCKKVAQLHNIPIEEVAQITSHNTKKFFSIPY